jgi:hypothetical protein
MDFMQNSLATGVRNLAFTLWLLCAFQCAEAQVVHLTAEIETASWNSEEPGVHIKTWTTQCMVATNAWLITGGPFGSLQWASGTNSLGRAERTLESADGNPARPPRTMDALSVPGNISWLAFCSGPFLKRTGKGLPLPSGFWKEYLPASWQTSEKITVFEDELGLPERIVLYDKSQPVLQYRATLTTNALGWTFPLEFYLAQYIPARSNAWDLELTAKGRIVAISEGAESQKTSHLRDSSAK